MIRNEVVTVDVGGSFIYPESVKITAGIGKGYKGDTRAILGINVEF